MSNISLREMSYQRKNSYLNKDSSSLNPTLIDELVDDIVTYIARTYPSMASDVESNVESYDNLENKIIEYIDNKKLPLVSESRGDLILKVTQRIFGYGILQPLLDDPTIFDIKTVGLNIRIKQFNKRKNSAIKFSSYKNLESYILSAITRNNSDSSFSNAIQVFTDTKTCKDFILRVSVALPPVSNQPFLSIRKVPKTKYTIPQLIDYGMFNQEISEYLVSNVKSGMNIVFCGKGGSGKTNLMNTLMEEIPQDESSVIVQESEELFNVSHPDITPLKLYNKRGESSLNYSLRNITIFGLRIDLDRIIIGESKEDETLEFANAMYTGTIGWTSFHAPSAKEALIKYQHLIEYSGTKLPIDTIRAMISNIDIVVYLNDFKCYEIAEVEEFDIDSNKIITRNIFEFTLTPNSNTGKFIKVNDSCEKILNKAKFFRYNKARKTN